MPLPPTRALRRPTTLVVLGAMLGVSFLAPPPAGADESSGSEHCVAEVIGREKDGEYLLGPVECYDTFLESSIAASATSSSKASGGGVTTAAMNLAGHFDGYNYSGSSFVVTGNDCLGGYLNLPSSWDNRVSSTFGGCPRVRHYTAFNLSGALFDTVSSGNMNATLNNASSSIQYLPF